MIPILLNIFRTITAPKLVANKWGLILILHTYSVTWAQDIESHIRKRTEIHNGISPKSVVASGSGIFAAQNMMYRHTVTLYNTKGEALAKIPDAVRFTDYGITKYGNSKYKGAPVEGVFVADGAYLWVSNYNMTGEEMTNHGCDNCTGNTYDNSFLYKINTTNYTIENVVEVGAVPKFIAVSEDEKTLLVSNWVSSDISVVDLTVEKEIKRVRVGTHPRGIAISKDGSKAFVTIMGSTKIAEINLENYSVNYIKNVGKSPRSIILADNDSTLYISLNSSNEILKYNRFTTQKTYCKTAAGPRSMTLSPNEKALYVVNYYDDVFTKINTDSMQVSATVKTKSKPIGICANWIDSEIWVACYSGTIEIFKDFELEEALYPARIFAFSMPLFNFNYEKLNAQDTVITEAETVLRAQIIEKPDAILTAQNEALPTIDSTTVVEEPESVVDNYKTNSYFKPKEKVSLVNENTALTDCSYHIIVGAFGVIANAERKAEMISKLGFDATIIKGQELNYVSTGCYTTRLSAELERKKVIQEIPESSSAWILKI